MANGKLVAKIYTWSSAGGEEGGRSLAAQADACVKLAREKGLAVGFEHVLRERSSGVGEERPVLNELRWMVARKEVDAVLAYSASRLARTSSEFLTLQCEFVGSGVAIWLVQDPRDGADVGGLERRLGGVVGRVPAPDLGERTRRAKESLAKGGWMPGGIGPGIYGYDYDPAQRRMALNEVEADVVLRAFREVDHGRPVDGLVQLFDAEGIPSKRGGSWKYAAMRNLLRNEAYTGEYFYGKTRTVRGPNGAVFKEDVPRDEWIRVKGFTTAIVPRNLFSRVQGRLRDLGSGRGRHYRRL